MSKQKRKNSQYATKADTIIWVLSVGAGVILAISGILYNFILIFQKAEERLTQDIREVRTEMRQEFVAVRQEISVIRQEMAEDRRILSQKIDALIAAQI